MLTNDGINDSQPKNFALDQNYPNPFNPSTTIGYRLDTPARVRLAVYDMRGRQVRTLVDQYQADGKYTVRWNANDDGSSMLPSGTYFVQLRVGDQTSIRKMIYSK
jgi:flagellar hook assembly protein FlgD